MIDKKHIKSLMRRAKATFHGASHISFCVNPIAMAGAIEDLDKIIREGVDEAHVLRDEINAKFKAEVDRY
jgi:hypothetical protein